MTTKQHAQYMEGQFRFFSIGVVKPGGLANIEDRYVERSARESYKHAAQAYPMGYCDVVAFYNSVNATEKPLAVLDISVIAGENAHAVIPGDVVTIHMEELPFGKHPVFYTAVGFMILVWIGLGVLIWRAS